MSEERAEYDRGVSRPSDGNAVSPPEVASSFKSAGRHRLFDQAGRSATHVEQDGARGPTQEHTLFCDPTRLKRIPSHSHASSRRAGVVASSRRSTA